MKGAQYFQLEKEGAWNWSRDHWPCPSISWSRDRKIAARVLNEQIDFATLDGVHTAWIEAAYECKFEVIISNVSWRSASLQKKSLETVGLWPCSIAFIGVFIQKSYDQWVFDWRTNGCIEVPCTDACSRRLKLTGSLDCRNFYPETAIRLRIEEAKMGELVDTVNLRFKYGAVWLCSWKKKWYPAHIPGIPEGTGALLRSDDDNSFR